MKKRLRSAVCALLSATLLLTGCGGSAADFTDEAVLKIGGQ